MDDKTTDGNKPHPRDVVIAFRVSAMEAAHLDAAGESLQTPRSRCDFARAAALTAAKQKVPPPSRPIRRPARRQPTADIQALARILAELGKVGSNLNQLAHHANRSGALPQAQVLASIAIDIVELKGMLSVALNGGTPAGAAP